MSAIPRFDPLLDDIRCYSLPYGGLGFVSHALTFYALTCLCYNRAPLWPASKIRWPIVGIYLAAATSIVGFAISIYTAVRCRSHWQIILLAVWQAIRSVFIGAVGVQTGRDVIHHEGNTTKDAFGWAWIYFLMGTAPGAVGMISLMNSRWYSHLQQFKSLTFAFGAIPAISIFVLALGCFHMTAINEKQGEYIFSKASLCTTVLFVILPALYSDWALGIMVANVSGSPISENAALFWGFWVANLLTIGAI